MRPADARDLPAPRRRSAGPSLSPNLRPAPRRAGYAGRAPTVRTGRARAAPRASGWRGGLLPRRVPWRGFGRGGSYWPGRPAPTTAGPGPGRPGRSGRPAGGRSPVRPTGRRFLGRDRSRSGADAGPVATRRARSGRGRPHRRLRGRTPIRARLVRGADGLSAGWHARRRPAGGQTATATHPGATGGPVGRAGGTASDRLRRRARGGRLLLSAAGQRPRIRLRPRPATPVPGRPAAGRPRSGLRLARLRQHDAAGRRTGLLGRGGRRHGNRRRNRPGRRRGGAHRRVDSHLAPARPSGPPWSDGFPSAHRIGWRAAVTTAVGRGRPGGSPDRRSGPAPGRRLARCGAVCRPPGPGATAGRRTGHR